MFKVNWIVEKTEGGGTITLGKTYEEIVSAFEDDNRMPILVAKFSDFGYDSPTEFEPLFAYISHPELNSYLIKFYSYTDGSETTFECDSPSAYPSQSYYN